MVLTASKQHLFHVLTKWTLQINCSNIFAGNKRATGNIEDAMWLSRELNSGRSSGSLSDLQLLIWLYFPQLPLHIVDMFRITQPGFAKLSPYLTPKFRSATLLFIPKKCISRQAHTVDDAVGALLQNKSYTFSILLLKPSSFRGWLTSCLQTRSFLPQFSWRTCCPLSFK